ncbi:MAG: hypothetical protein PF513_00990 [Tenericutes bacterium]|jgi:uncharacterized protein YcfL|nr:hypothetical protein [Mycoplasmatota bacterium]
MMKKVNLVLLILLLIFLSGCQSKSEAARETVYDIYEMHSTIVLEDVSIEDNFFYSGFSSYTTASDEDFKLILLKNDVYSELIIKWEDFSNEEVTIKLIQIIYYDFENEAYFTVKSEEEDGLILDVESYDELVFDFSKIRIDDIQWVLEKLGYEIE